MKNLFLLLKTALMALLPILAQAHLTQAGGAISVALPPLGALLSGNTVSTIGTVLYWLELAARIIPTAQDFTPLSFVIQLLSSIVPNQAVGPAGESGVHETVSVFRRFSNLFHHALPVVAPVLASPVNAAPNGLVTV